MATTKSGLRSDFLWGGAVAAHQLEGAGKLAVRVLVWLTS